MNFYNELLKINNAKYKIKILGQSNFKVYFFYKHHKQLGQFIQLLIKTSPNLFNEVSKNSAINQHKELNEKHIHKSIIKNSTDLIIS